MRIYMPEADIKGRDKQLHHTDTVVCNYLFLPLIPALSMQVLKYSAKFTQKVVFVITW